MGENRAAVPLYLRPLTKLFVWALVIFLALYFSRAFRVAGFGFLAIAAVSAALQPLTRLIPGKRWVAGAIVGLLPGLLLVGSIIAAGYFLAEPIRDEVRKWPQAQEALNQALASFSQRAGIDPPLTIQKAFSTVSPQGGAASLASALTSWITDILLALTLVCFGTIFFLATPKGALLNPTLQLLPPHRRPQLRAALDDLYPQLRWWVIGTTVAMISVATASWIGFKIAGLQFHVPLALLAGFAEIAPNIGPAAAFLLALAFAAAQGAQVVLYVAIVWAVIQTLESNVITPLVMRRAVDLPPIVTLLTIIFWGHVFGITGLLLAIPLDLTAWTFAKHFLLHPDENARPPQEGAGASA